MQLKFTRMEKAVGAFVIGIVVLLLSTVIIIGRGKDWFEKYATYYTTFNEGYNFQENTPVKLFKTDIGKVKQITLAENKVRVKLAILERYAGRITQGALATVESPTFIGSEYISILPGLKSAPPIPEGGEIPSRERKSISDILAEFEVEKTAKMVVKAVQDLAELARLLKEPSGPLLTALNNVSKTTAHIEGIAADIQKGEGSLGALVKSRALVDAILENLAQIDQILSNLKLASQKAPRAMDQVNDNLATLQQAGHGAAQTIAALPPIVEKIEAAVESLRVILHNLEQSSVEVPSITRSTRQGIEEIRDGVADIDKVVKSLQQNFLIRKNLPPEPVPGDTAAGLRR